MSTLKSLVVTTAAVSLLSFSAFAAPAKKAEKPAAAPQTTESPAATTATTPAPAATPTAPAAKK